MKRTTKATPAPTVKSGDGLNDKQQAFVEHYLVCWNAAEAARRAGYSPKSAREQGYDLLTKPHVQSLIKSRLAEHKLDADAVLSMLAEHARGSLDYFLNASGGIDIRKARRAGKLHLLKSYSTGPKGKRIELHDQQAALVQIGRALGIFVDKTALTDPTGKHEYIGLTDDERAKRVAELLDRARARRDGRASGSDGSGNSD